MNIRIGCALVAAMLALGAQSVPAQTMNGCPTGYAMQSSSPSGKTVTCVAVPDAAAISAIDARVGALELLNESDIIGRWALSGTTNCLQSSRNFDANFNPVVIPGAATIVSQLIANSTGFRTFHAGGTGTSSGVTQALTHAPTVLGAPAGAPPAGASVTSFGEDFTWHIQADGTLFIQDTNPIVQAFLAPPSRAGFTATILDLQPFVGHISKDRRTITMAHPGMAVETSVFKNPAGDVLSSTPRFCWRHRVFTRLLD